MIFHYHITFNIILFITLNLIQNLISSCTVKFYEVRRESTVGYGLSAYFFQQELLVWAIMSLWAYRPMTVTLLTHYISGDCTYVGYFGMGIVIGVHTCNASTLPKNGYVNTPFYLS